MSNLSSEYHWFKCYAVALQILRINAIIFRGHLPHPADKTLASDSSINSFMMVVYQNICCTVPTMTGRLILIRSTHEVTASKIFQLFVTKWELHSMCRWPLRYLTASCGRLSVPRVLGLWTAHVSSEIAHNWLLQCGTQPNRTSLPTFHGFSISCVIGFCLTTQKAETNEDMTIWSEISSCRKWNSPNRKWEVSHLCIQ